MADAFTFENADPVPGTPARQLKQSIDQTGRLWREGKLADKPVTAFISASNQHCGNEATILSLANVFNQWGLIVPSRFTDPVVSAAGGNPYGTSASGPPTGDGPDAATLEAARYQGRRLAQITIRLLAGSRVTDPAADDGNGRGTGAGTVSQTA